MKFQMTTTLYAEENCVWEHRTEIAALGTRAIIITGRHSAKTCGALDDLTKALDADRRTGKEVLLFF